MSTTTPVAIGLRPLEGHALRRCAMPERRALLIGSLGFVVVPRPVEAQRSNTVHRIGFVSPTTRGPRNEAFVLGLRDLGYVEPGNVVVEMRFADGLPERLPGLIAELVAAKVDVLVVGSTIGARAARRATTTTPIVFAGSSDPVAGGIVSSLARPEGNITGTSLAVGDGFAGKWLELLAETVPDLSRCAVLWSSSNTSAARFVKELELAARALKLRLEVHHAAASPELDQALDAIGSSSTQGLIVTPSPFAATQRARLIRFAMSRRLPAMYFDEEFADSGGLMSYGPGIGDAYRLAATYVDKILKGARPGDLPVEQPTRFRLTVNLGVARALGLKIPGTVLLRADRVIE
jgi:putative tryptophan/tyrosine transport system substrate-binding protein